MTLAEARRGVTSSDPRVRSDAERYLAARARRRAKGAPRRKEAAADGRAARARTAKVRREVFARSAGACQVCLTLHPRDPHAVATATDMHHVLGGGERKAKERPETCLALCGPHHDEKSTTSVHAGHLPTLEAAHRYCFENRMHEAAAALARRIEKVEEARRFAFENSMEYRGPGLARESIAP